MSKKLTVYLSDEVESIMKDRYWRILSWPEMVDMVINLWVEWKSSLSISASDRVVVDVTKEWKPYIKSVFKKQWDSFILAVMEKDEWRLSWYEFDDHIEYYKLHPIKKMYDTNKDLFDYLTTH